MSFQSSYSYSYSYINNNGDTNEQFIKQVSIPKQVKSIKGESKDKSSWKIEENNNNIITKKTVDYNKYKYFDKMKNNNILIPFNNDFF